MSLPDEVYEFTCGAEDRDALRREVERKLRTYFRLHAVPRPIEHMVELLTFDVTDESHEVRGDDGPVREITQYRAEVRAKRTF